MQYVQRHTYFCHFLIFTYNKIYNVKNTVYFFVYGAHIILMLKASLPAMFFSVLNDMQWCLQKCVCLLIRVFIQKMTFPSGEAGADKTVTAQSGPFVMGVIKN